MTYRLATIDHGGTPTAVIEKDGKLYPVTRLDGGLFEFLQDWDQAKPQLDQLAESVSETDAIDRASASFLAPVLLPRKVFCAGANYYKHLTEMGVPDNSKAKQRLFFFTKPPTTSVVGPGNTVVYPRDTKQLDWEIELTAVIGKTARAVSEEDAMSHVAAYTVAIDFSARDLNAAPDTFYKMDWVAGKAQDTCGPMGPYLVPADFVSDPHNLAMKLSVNGAVKQDDSSSDMIFSIAEQIAALSRIMTLEPGDVVLTGTPAGVGKPKGEFLSVGDQVDAEIAEIGKLSVTIQPPR